MVWSSGDSLNSGNLNRKSGIGYVLNPSGGDDTSLIQAALSSFTVGGFGTQRGGRVELSAGTFITSSTLTVPPGVTFAGVSREGSVISYSGSSFAITVGVGTTENSKGVGLENLHIVGNSNAAGAIQIGDDNVASNFVSDVRLSHLQINNFAKSGATALFMQNPSHVYVDTVHIYNVASGTALHIDANGLNTGVYAFDACRFGGSSSIEAGKACVITSTSNVVDSVNFTGCFFRAASGHVVNIDNGTSVNFYGSHFEASSATAVIRAKTWLASTLLGCTFGMGGTAVVGVHITGEGSARRLTIGNNWMTNFPSSSTAILITPPGAGTNSDILLLPNHFTVGSTPVEFDDSAGVANIMSSSSAVVGRIAVRNDGTASIPAFAFNSERSLGFYRAGAQQLGLSSNMQMLGPANSAANPTYTFTSNASLGWYRAGGSNKMGLANGNLNMPSIPPATGTSGGSQGDWAWKADSGTSFFYVCSSDSSWMRAALVPF